VELRLFAENGSVEILI